MTEYFTNLILLLLFLLGIDMVSQAVVLARRPHIIIATPGRLVDHLEHTRGFSLSALKYLVLDEADRMLGLDFEEEVRWIFFSLRL